MERDISLAFLWKILKKCWIFVVVAALVTAIVVGVFVSLFIPKKYSSSVNFYVVNTNTSYDYTTSALLSASTYLINDYVEMIKSERILIPACEVLEKQYNYKMTPSDLSGMISSSSKSDTSIFSIKITHTDPKVALKVAEVLADIAPEKVTEIAKPERLTYQTLSSYISTIVNYYNNLPANESKGKLDVTKDEIADVLEQKKLGISTTLNCIEVVTTPVLDTAHDTPDVAKSSILGALVAAVLVYLFFFIRQLFNNNVTTEDDVKKMINRPLIGTIPNWNSIGKKYKAGQYYGKK